MINEFTRDSSCVLLYNNTGGNTSTYVPSLWFLFCSNIQPTKVPSFFFYISKTNTSSYDGVHIWNIMERNIPPSISYNGFKYI